jgi:hypothetical protein
MIPIQRIRTMKTLLVTLIFFSFWSPSFAWMGVVGEPIPCSPYYPIYNLTNFSVTIAGPSEAEMALSAKIDSQEVRMNLLFDALDSAKILLTNQEAEIKKMERINAENKARIHKQKQRRDKESKKSMWIISLLGISTVLSALFAFRFFGAKKMKNEFTDRSF